MRDGEGRDPLELADRARATGGCRPRRLRAGAECRGGLGRSTAPRRGRWRSGASCPTRARLAGDAELLYNNNYQIAGAGACDDRRGDEPRCAGILIVKSRADVKHTPRAISPGSRIRSAGMRAIRCGRDHQRVAAAVDTNHKRIASLPADQAIQTQGESGARPEITRTSCSPLFTSVSAPARSGSCCCRIPSPARPAAAMHRSPAATSLIERLRPPRSLRRRAGYPWLQLGAQPARADHRPSPRGCVCQGALLIPSLRTARLRRGRPRRVSPRWRSSSPFASSTRAPASSAGVVTLLLLQIVPQRRVLHRRRSRCAPAAAMSAQRTRTSLLALAAPRPPVKGAAPGWLLAPAVPGRPLLPGASSCHRV